MRQIRGLSCSVRSRGTAAREVPTTNGTTDSTDSRTDSTDRAYWRSRSRRGVRSGVTAVDRGGDVAPTARRSTIQPRRGPRWRPCEALSRAHRYVPRDPKKTSSLRANFSIAGTPDPFNPCCHPLNPYPPSSVGPPERLFARTHDAPRIEVLLSTISPRYRGGEPRGLKGGSPPGLPRSGIRYSGDGGSL